MAKQYERHIALVIEGESTEALDFAVKNYRAQIRKRAQNGRKESSEQARERFRKRYRANRKLLNWYIEERRKLAMQDLNYRTKQNNKRARKRSSKLKDNPEYRARINEISRQSAARRRKCPEIRDKKNKYQQAYNYSKRQEIKARIDLDPVFAQAYRAKRAAQQKAWRTRKKLEKQGTEK